MRQNTILVPYFNKFSPFTEVGGAIHYTTAATEAQWFRYPISSGFCTDVAWQCNFKQKRLEVLVCKSCAVVGV